MNISEGNKTESLVLDKYTVFNNRTDKKFAVIESVNLKKTSDLDKTYIHCILRCKGGIKIEGVRFQSNDLEKELDVFNSLVGKLVAIVFRGNVYRDRVSIQIDSVNELPEQPAEIIDMLYDKVNNTIGLNKEILELSTLEQATKDILATTILPKLSKIIVGNEVAVKGLYTKILYYCLQSPMLNEEQKDILTVGYSLYNFREKDNYGEFIQIALNNADKMKAKNVKRIKSLIFKLSGCNVCIDDEDQIILEVIRLHENLIK